jgi:hypothetical protein
VSILASVEKPADGIEALSKGYAPAIVVPEHTSDKARIERGIRWIPCPAQTRENVTCSSCRLCFDADTLRARNAGISFAAHGSGVKKVRRRLAVIQ